MTVYADQPPRESKQLHSAWWKPFLWTCSHTPSTVNYCCCLRETWHQWTPQSITSGTTEHLTNQIHSEAELVVFMETGLYSWHSFVRYTTQCDNVFLLFAKWLTVSSKVVESRFSGTRSFLRQSQFLTMCSRPVALLCLPRTRNEHEH